METLAVSCIYILGCIIGLTNRDTGKDGAQIPSLGWFLSEKSP